MITPKFLDSVFSPARSAVLRLHQRCETPTRSLSSTGFPYNVRSISPVTPLDTFVTSKNVVIATNPSGTPSPVPGLPTNLTAIGTFTGSSGANSVSLPRVYTATGADTEVLGNFEYRIPLIGRAVSAALFVDVGSAFNLRSKGQQTYSSEFLADQPFLSTIGFITCPRLPSGFASVSLTTLAACKNFSNLALSPAGGLVARDNRLITGFGRQDTQFTNPLTLLPFGLQQVFLRGDAQTNTVVRLNQSLFAKFTNIRSSMGGELRLQIPVLNVPFRLIYAYNPNARRDQTINGFPFFFNEKKTVFRFSVGRTF